MKFPYETQFTITEWQHETFGPPTSAANTAARANAEMAELLREACGSADVDRIMDEVADVVIILYRLSSFLGRDIHEAIDRKMEINRRRTWVKDPVTGKTERVREAA
jgi:NTP pyrophosphatase (non-canonical NTP hydrolase)